MTDDTGHSTRRRMHTPCKHTKRKKNESVAEMIDRLLMDSVRITAAQKRRQASVLEAIMLQLAQKAYAGNIRAKRVLLRYREFAEAHSNKKPRLTFLESDYTRAVAKSGGDNNG